MIWDCKFSQEEINLRDSNLKRQARDYIQRTNQSRSIRTFSNGLGTFLIITNQDNVVGLDKFVEYQYGYESWGGAVGLLKSSALLLLYDFLHAASGDFSKRQACLTSTIASKLKRGSPPVLISIGTEEAKEIIKITEEKMSAHDIDSGALKEHLISNKIY